VHLEADPAELSVQVADAERASEAILELSRAGVGVANFSLGQPSLDEVFLALTGHSADESADTEPAIEEEAA
jgi:ABC-2 type transport system ATP-binding protein